MARFLNFQPSFSWPVHHPAILCPISDLLGDVNLRNFRSDIITQETRNGSDNRESLIVKLERS